MSNSEGNPNVTTNYEPYFKVMKQVAAERGGAYSFGTTWAAVDSTRDGERFMVEASFQGENVPFFVGYAYEVGEDFDYETNPAKLNQVDVVISSKTSDLMRFVKKWA